MSDARERVGFIGLGSMGAPLAGHLLAKGWPVTLFARRPEVAAPLVALGATAVATPREVGAASDVVCTMVTATADVEQVLLGPDGVVEGLRPGGLVVDLSTIDPDGARRLARRLAEGGIGMVDAPVSGGPEGARQGSLTVMAGGDPAAVARARRVLECFSARLFHMGASGAGQVTKACHQLLLLITTEGVAESLALAAKGGVDPGAVRDVMLQAMASSRVLDRFGGSMAARNFEPGIPAKLYRKDAQIVHEFAARVGASLPAGEVVRANIARVLEAGRGEQDLSVLITALE
jgi:2-hydroxy-3-oxopropionate reductase